MQITELRFCLCVENKTIAFPTLAKLKSNTKTSKISSAIGSRPARYNYYADIRKYMYMLKCIENTEKIA